MRFTAMRHAIDALLDEMLPHRRIVIRIVGGLPEADEAGGQNPIRATEESPAATAR
jgi:hypothetical protein